jgi:hypothetical protein
MRRDQGGQGQDTTQDPKQNSCPGIHMARDSGIQLARDPACLDKDLISELVFDSSQMTTRRRSAPIPQVSCPTCMGVRPGRIRCFRDFSTGHHLQWKCNSEDLAQAVYQPIITCEGCSHEDSHFVYEDSCSLSFVIHPRDSFWGGLLTAVLVLVMSSCILFGFLVCCLLPRI